MASGGNDMHVTFLHSEKLFAAAAVFIYFWLESFFKCINSININEDLKHFCEFFLPLSLIDWKTAFESG